MSIARLAVGSAIAGLYTLLLFACNTSKEEVEGGEDSGILNQPGIVYDTASCEDGECTWSVGIRGGFDSLDLYIVQTGASTWESGCTQQMGEGGMLCGVWSEHHSGFQVSPYNHTYNGQTFSEIMTLVSSTDDQTTDDTTYFDLSNAETAGQLTWMYTTATNGTRTACTVSGQNTGFFSYTCEPPL